MREKDDEHSIAYAKHLPEIRAYLKKHPQSTYEEMKKDLGLAGLSKPWFLVIKSDVNRPKGPGSLRTPSALLGQPSVQMKIEILDTIDSSNMSTEVMAHYRSHILPMIKRLHPDGPAIHWAFLSDPPCIEIRKMVG